jgi:cell division transport system permease protein
VKRQTTADKKPGTNIRNQGAIQSKTGRRDRFDAWLAHHSTSAIESLLRLFQTPLQSGMTWLVVAIAVTLPATLFVALTNLEQLTQQWQKNSEMSVFLRQNAQEKAINELQQRWSARADIAQLTYISPTDALAEFRLHSGLGRIVDSLEQNPLPSVLLVQPKTSIPSLLENLQQELAREPLVTEVRIDMQWIRRLQEFMRLAERLVLALSGLLTLGLLVIIGNTIRLAIENRRDEILIIKLVGGTNAYVRRPLLYTGLWFGLGGGILAALLLAIGLRWLGNPIAQLANLYQSSFQLHGLGLTGSLQLILMTGLMGLLGAWLAVGRHLSRIEPR